MRITWDEPKRLANIDAHGFDFAAAERFPWDHAMVREVRPSRHGTRRFQAIAALEGEIVSIIFSPLGTEGVSVISMRIAGKKERRLHDEA